MTIYATGNALGSTDPRDLLDNAQNFDNAVNDVVNDTWDDRFGRTRKTLKGYDADFEEDQAIRAAAFQAFLEGTGWTSIGAYTAGVAITSHTQTVEFEGQPYSLKPSIPASLDAPYVTTGAWATEGVNFKLVGDNSLRQDLTGGDGALVGVVRGFIAKTISKVSEFFARGSIDPLEYGSLITSRTDPNDSGTWDATAAIESAIAAAQASRWSKRVSLSCDLGVTRTIIVPKGVQFETPGGELTALDGFTLLTAVLQFGNNSAVPEPDGRWTGSSEIVRVNCRGMRLIGVDFNRVWGYGHFPTGSVSRCAYVAVKSTSGYGLKLGRWEVTAPGMGSSGFNAGVDSIGYLINTSDGDHGTLNAVGFFCYMKVTGNNNSFAAGHPFGLYRNSAGIPKTCPFGIGVWNEGQANNFSNMVMDSISLIDYDAPASLTNGGIAYLNRGNGFQSVFDKCRVFQPDRSADGEVSPVNRVVPFMCSQSGSYTSCEVVDYNTTPSVMTEHYQGINVGTCNIVSRREYRIYAIRQILFNRKAWFSRGLEFQATTQDADERSSNFGACSFSMANRKYIVINTNFEGTIRAVRIQRRTVAFTSADLTNIASDLDTSDRGDYKIWYEPTKKLLVWDGTAWRDAMGALV